MLHAARCSTAEGWACCCRTSWQELLATLPCSFLLPLLLLPRSGSCPSRSSQTSWKLRVLLVRATLTSLRQKRCGFCPQCGSCLSTPWLGCIPASSPWRLACALLGFRLVCPPPPMFQIHVTLLVFPAILCCIAPLLRIPDPVLSEPGKCYYPGLQDSSNPVRCLSSALVITHSRQRLGGVGACRLALVRAPSAQLHDTVTHTHHPPVCLRHAYAHTAILLSRMASMLPLDGPTWSRSTRQT
jgi:hypothetical protein